MGPHIVTLNLFLFSTVGSDTYEPYMLSYLCKMEILPLKVEFMECKYDAPVRCSRLVYGALVFQVCARLIYESLQPTDFIFDQKG